MEEKVFFTNKHGQKLCGVLHTPKKYTDKCVLLIHGFASGKDAHGTYIDLAHELVARDIASFRFDFAARGESEGEAVETTLFSQVNDLAAAVDYLRKEFSEFAIVASSFGGGVTLEYAGQHPAFFKAIVLWNPLIDYTFDGPEMLWNTDEWNTDVLQKAQTEGKVYIGKAQIPVGKEFIEVMQYAKPWQQIDHISSPMLFVHGTHDTVVSLAQSQNYAKMFGKKLVVIEGAEHGFSENYKYEEQANRATVDFILENL